MTPTFSRSLFGQYNSQVNSYSSLDRFLSLAGLTNSTTDESTNYEKTMAQWYCPRISGVLFVAVMRPE